MALSETNRLEAFSDGVFAIAITLLILEIRVPPSMEHGGLGTALARLWPSYLAYLASFVTVGIMWINHHRLFSLIKRNDDMLMLLNLLLLLGISWIPFPTALLAEHLLEADGRIAGIVYASSFFGIAIVFNVMWRYVVRSKSVSDHLDVQGITRQYSIGPIMYGVLILIALWNPIACLLMSLLYGLYFALPPKLWHRKAARAQL
jgi:uncharacterized membrane protein